MLGDELIGSLQERRFRAQTRPRRTLDHCCPGFRRDLPLFGLLLALLIGGALACGDAHDDFVKRT